MENLKLEDIIKTKDEILDGGHKIENEMIRGVDIEVMGHYGNIVCLNVWTGCCSLIHDYNNTYNLGLVIKALVELLDLTAEDGYSFSKMKDIPIRIVYDGRKSSKVRGFGHFMKDKFVYTSDLVRIGE